MQIISRIVDWITTPYTIYLIIRDPAIPGSVKWRAAIGLAVLFAYLISPLDLIPDFIPLSGLIDDLIVVPVGLALVRKLTPGIDIIETRNQAQAGTRRVVHRTIWLLVIVLTVGLLWLGLLIYIAVKLIQA